MILILKLNLTSLRNIYIKMFVVLNEDHFNVYVSQQSKIQFEDDDAHAVYMRFRSTTLSSLRTTTCDALIVTSEWL